jgi:hypothetical protein
VTLVFYPLLSTNFQRAAHARVIVRYPCGGPTNGAVPAGAHLRPQQHYLYAARSVMSPVLACEGATKVVRSHPDTYCTNTFDIIGHCSTRASREIQGVWIAGVSMQRNWVAAPAAIAAALIDAVVSVFIERYRTSRRLFKCSPLEM